MKRVAFFAVLLLFATACNFTESGQLEQAEMEEQQKARAMCAEPRLNTSFDFHKKAKDFFASYYRTRKESELFFAWYASEDSIYMARSVRKCYDKRNKHFYAVKNIFHKNKILQRLIVQNMRQPAQTQLSELFLDEYRKIFVRDIQ